MDLAILSSRIFTGDPQHHWAEAVYVEGKHIAAVGNNQTIKSLIRSSRTQVLELPGRLVTPGFVDTHCHFGTLGASLLMVDLSDLHSLDACRTRIAKAIQKIKPGEWVLGKGWNQHQWEDKREPTLKDLDDIAPEHPAIMYRACGHTLWVNSFALKLAGVTAGTPDPPGGRIERDPETGDPNGLIREARGIIEAVMPNPTLDDWKSAVLAAQNVSLSFGLTGVHSFEGLPQWQAMKALETEGKLRIRVHHSFRADAMDRIISENLKPGYGTDRLWVGHIKLFADGSLGSGTALLHDPYSDDPSQSGLAVTSVDDMADLVARAYHAGYDVAIHAIGDKATSNSLRAISEARASCSNRQDYRDRIEHIQLFRPLDLSLIKRLGVTAAVQPVFLHTDWSVAETKWGKERCKRGGYAWKTIQDSGIPLQFGSDSPVESINPLLGLHGAVTRQTVKGEPEGGWFPEQKLTLEDGIKGFTQVPAWTARRVDKLGAIRVGNWADFTIFEKDLFQIPAAEWPSIDIAMTIVDGEIVYRK